MNRAVWARQPDGRLTLTGKALYYWCALSDVEREKSIMGPPTKALRAFADEIKRDSKRKLHPSLEMIRSQLIGECRKYVIGENEKWP